MYAEEKHAMVVISTRLAELQEHLAQVKQHLCEQCQRVSFKHKQERLSKTSVADLLGQTQLFEVEKAGLIE